MPNTIEVPSFSSVPSGTKNYRRFRGVDYSTDETQIDDSRSLEKMYADISGEGLQPVLNDYLYV